MFVSGLTLQDRPGAKKRYESGQGWEQYPQWTDRTSILLPFPPQLYQPLPTIIKRTAFLDFPIYVFDPAKHADQKKAHDGSAEQSQERSHSTDRRAGSVATFSSAHDPSCEDHP